MRNFFEEEKPCCEVSFWISLLMSLVFVLFAAATSGLALGLLSFSQVDLEVFVKAGQPKIQKHAAKIMSIVKNEHLVLCTLLLAKTMALEAVDASLGVSVLMEKMFPERLAIIFTCTLVGLVTEIIPQALCSRYGLSVGATLSPFVRALLLVFFPLAYPISKVLDWLLGKGHAALLGREELKSLVNLHANEAGKGGELSRYETAIIGGALDLTLKTAKHAMTPITQTFSLDINSKLDMYTMGLIMSKGHSRVPIYSGNPTNIIGLILVKNLIFCRPEDETPIKYLTLRRIPRVGEDWPLYDILTQFQRGQSHMAVVVKNKNDTRATAPVAGVGHHAIEKGDYVSISTDWNSVETEYYSATLKNMMENELMGGESSDPHHKKLKQIHEIDSRDDSDYYYLQSSNEQVVGIITLEDIMEELLQEDILDETDLYVDVHQNIRIDVNHPRRASTSSSRSRSFHSLSTYRQQWKVSNSSSRISFFSPSDILPISPPRRSSVCFP